MPRRRLGRTFVRLRLTLGLLEHATVRRYLWALYQSWVFDINPSDRGLDQLERGLRLKPDYREVDRLRLRVEQSLVYKVYELLAQEGADARARICALLELDDERAAELLERVEAYRRPQQQRGREEAVTLLPLLSLLFPLPLLHLLCMLCMTNPLP